MNPRIETRRKDHANIGNRTADKSSNHRTNDYRESEICWMFKFFQFAGSEFRKLPGECPLFPIAVVQIKGKLEKSGAAFGQKRKFKF